MEKVVNHNEVTFFFWGGGGGEFSLFSMSSIFD